MTERTYWNLKKSGSSQRLKEQLIVNMLSSFHRLMVAPTTVIINAGTLSSSLQLLALIVSVSLLTLEAMEEWNRGNATSSTKGFAL